MDNVYIFLKNNSVLNVAIMEVEPVSQEIVDLLKKSNDADTVLRLDNGQSCDNGTETIISKKYPSIGDILTEHGFIPPRPGDEYILNSDNTDWVLPFSSRNFSENEELVMNLELNYWDFE